MDWKEYEQEIATYFRAEYPLARITANAKIPGKFSQIDRQIDLLIEEQACDFEFRIVIDAKYRNRKADVRDVEEFLGLAIGLICGEGQITADVLRVAYWGDGRP